MAADQVVQVAGHAGSVVANGVVGGNRVAALDVQPQAPVQAAGAVVHTPVRAVRAGGQGVIAKIQIGVGRIHAHFMVKAPVAVAAFNEQALGRPVGRIRHVGCGLAANQCGAQLEIAIGQDVFAIAKRQCTGGRVARAHAVGVAQAVVVRRDVVRKR